MLVETAGMVLPEAVWGYLLHREGMPSSWVLPFGGEPSLDEGRLWLVRQGLLVASDTQSVLHSPLQQTMTTLAGTEWALHVRGENVRAALLGVKDGWLWAQGTRNQRITLFRTTQPTQTLAQAVDGKEAAYGMCVRGETQWLGRMAWDDARAWLTEQVQGR